MTMETLITLPTDHPPHARLGALIRKRYKEQDLSMDRLAEAAGLSRSTVHRIINAANVDVIPDATSIAQVALAAGVTDEEVQATVDDDALRRKILLWMGNERANQMRDYARSRRVGFGGERQRVDLLALSPSRVSVRLEVEAEGAERDEAMRELADALSDAGWTVARPFNGTG